MPDSCVEPGSVIPAHPGRCNIIDFDAHRPTVVLWGDSHAWQEIPGLKYEARRAHVNLVAFVMGTCPPMLPRAPIDDRDTDCVENARLALQFIHELGTRTPPFTVVLGAHWHLYRDTYRRLQRGYEPATTNEAYFARRATLFHDGAGRLFTTLARWHAVTDVLGQAPTVPDDPARCRAGEHPYSCDLPRRAALPAEGEGRRWLEQRRAALPAAGRYLDVADRLCSATTCRALVGTNHTFIDDWHLSPAAAATMHRMFRPTMTALRART